MSVSFSDCDSGAVTAMVRDGSDQWTFQIISVRDPRTDFRRDLLFALRCTGVKAVYVRLGRRCLIDDGSGKGIVSRSPLAVLAMMWEACRRSRKVCIIHSVNTGFPFFSLLMRLCAFRAVWLFDEHDDLLYDTARALRYWEQMKLAFFRALSSRSICASPKLCARIRRAVLIPNASSVRWRTRSQCDVSKIVILSNVDERFDFRMVRDFLLCAPEIEVHLFGGTPKSETLRSDLNDLCVHGLHYRGGYETGELQSILDEYSVMFVPYKIDSSTIYIDPLRFYHGLNNGLELISSRIPRACDFEARLHLVNGGEEAARLIGDLGAGRLEPRNRGPFPAMSWQARAGALVTVAETLVRTPCRAGS